MMEMTHAASMTVGIMKSISIGTIATM